MVRKHENEQRVKTLTCDFPRPHRWNACFTNAEHAVLRGVLECAINTCAVWSECLARFVVLEVKAHSPRDSNANHILRFWPPGARKSTDVAFYDMLHMSHKRQVARVVLVCTLLTFPRPYLPPIPRNTEISRGIVLLRSLWRSYAHPK